MDRTDKSLIDAHCDGDGRAFAELLRRHGPALLGYLRRMTDNADRAEDIFQETFKRVHERAHTLRGDNVRAWMFTIATRIAMDGFRRAKRLKCVSLDANMGHGDGDKTNLAGTIAEDCPSDPAEQLIKAEQKQQVRQAIRSLPPKQRATLILAYYRQMSYAEVAGVLGCSRGTVKTHMFRALKTLAKHLPNITGCVI